MKTILNIAIFLSAILLRVQSFEGDAIFKSDDIYNQDVTLNYGVIAPGTKWCGSGNRSSSYDDLGWFSETDKCCRAHDHCPDIILPRSTLYSLHNPDMFPRLSCECDQVFFNCLKNANDYASKSVGRLYFAIRGVCFKLSFRVLQCTEYQKGYVRKRCIKYEYDVKKPMVWQYFDNPFYVVKK